MRFCVLIMYLSKARGGHGEEQRKYFLGECYSQVRRPWGRAGAVPPRNREASVAMSGDHGGTSGGANSPS